MCYCNDKQYYIRKADFTSKHGVTSVTFYQGYMYIGGSIDATGGAGEYRFTPVFGYG